MKMMGVEMKKAGTEEEIHGCQPCCEKSSDGSEKKIYYPMIETWRGDLPGTDNVEAGKDYLIVAVVHCTERRQHEDEKTKKIKNKPTLEIREIGFKAYSDAKKEPKDMTEDEIDEEIAKS